MYQTFELLFSVCDVILASTLRFRVLMFSNLRFCVFLCLQCYFKVQFPLSWFPYVCDDILGSSLRFHVFLMFTVILAFSLRFYILLFKRDEA